MGGACCVCGYNRCLRALSAHHLDPSQKDFNVGQAKANPKSWTKIVEELRKCVLLCKNCHDEVHDGIVDVPLEAPRFDETFAEYEWPPPKPKVMKKLVAKPPRPTRDELAALLLEHSALTVARMYDVSSAAVAKWCRKLDVKPMPRGYWAKVYAKQGLPMHLQEIESDQLSERIST